ncbi:MAG: DUF6029 family protein [Myroides sp.]|nr:DUF6029 family protein [Myroides sp.]
MKKITLFAILCLGAQANAQIRVGIESNSQYYLDDKKIKIEPNEAEDRFRSNNYIKVDYSLKNFEFGVQAEGYLPKAILNYNPDLIDFNIGAVYARYNNYEKGIDITAGHIYEQFGSGLALRFWEDRALGINNSLFGGRVKLRIADAANIKMLAGKQRVGMGFDLSDGTVYGADAEIDVAQVINSDNLGLKVGASYVGKYENLSELYPTIPRTTDVFGPRVDFTSNAFNLNVEYLYKTESIHVENMKVFGNTLRNGNALLLNAGFNSSNFGVNLNTRRVENFGFFSQSNMAGNVFNYGMINYVPSLVKQYDHSLQNIYVYQALNKMTFDDTREKLGEIGGQFDMFFQVPEGTLLGGKTGAYFAVNGSYWAGLKNDVVYAEDEYGWQYVQDLKSSSVFGFGTKAYSDFGVEYRKTFNDKLSAIFSYLNQYYNSDFLEGKGYSIKSNIIAAEATYFLSEMKSIRLELQHMWADHDKKNWAGGTIEYTPNQTWSVFLHDMYNYGNDLESQRLHYYNFGGAYSKGATRIAASYGRQRGGMICVGGVCRYVPESNGFTLNLTTNF